MISEAFLLSSQQELLEQKARQVAELNATVGILKYIDFLLDQCHQMQSEPMPTEAVVDKVNNDNPV